MKIIKLLKDFLNAIWNSDPSIEIQCPYCKASVTLPSFARTQQRKSVRNVVASGSIILCPKCGKNVSNYQDSSTR